MKSSYTENINYGNIFSIITFLKNPKKIVEFGILNGYSLKEFTESANSNCSIEAYDIFDNFTGNHANKDTIYKTFEKYSNVKIEYGDFYKKIEEIDDKSIDILHIDIANNGDVYEFIFQNYIQKMNTNGIIILEGGAIERDNIEWMNKYNKPKIKPIIDKYSNIYNIKTVGTMPSITLIKI